MPQRNSVLVDSSFLIALYDHNSDHHDDVNAVVELYNFDLLVPQVTLTEVVYLWKRDSGVQVAANFLTAFIASQFTLQDLDYTDLTRARDIMQQYASARFDFLDCALMALSERLNITPVCTLDGRDFRIFRPTHAAALDILP